MSQLPLEAFVYFILAVGGIVIFGMAMMWALEQVLGDDGDEK